MKLVAKLCALLVILSCFACKKTMTHKIRLKNDSSTTIGTVNVGSISFRDTKAGTATDYQEIPEGDYEITGDFTTSINISAKKSGDHLWSLVVANGSTSSSQMEVSLVQDK